MSPEAPFRPEGSERGRGDVYGFSPAFFNLSETTRLLHIALEIQSRGHRVVFFSHGGDFEHLVEAEGLSIVALEPRLSESMIEHMLQVARFEKRAQLMTEGQVRAFVAPEVAAYQQHGLRVLVTGFNFTSSVSARAAGVPLVWFLQAPSVVEFYEQGLATWPEAFDLPPLTLVPRSWRNRFFNLVARRAGYGTRPFNRVASEFGLPAFSTAISLLRGDLTIVGDLVELTRLRPTVSLPARNFVGPILPAVADELDPRAVEHIEAARSAGRRAVFLAMGSSGNPELFRTIIAYLDNRQDLQAVVAYTNILSANDLPQVSERTLLVKLLLAEEAARRADFAIIHGGHGTVYTQAYSGTPFIGIPMQMEQEWNLTDLASHGGGRIVRKRGLNATRLEEAIDGLLGDFDLYQGRALVLRDQLPESHASERAADLILDLK